nr:molybdopterin-dependent oxidoreductase [Nitratireductor luteus]
MICMGILIAFGLHSTAQAETLPTPAGETILVIDGNIENTNAGDEAHFDRQMLEGLGMVEIVTTTPWYTSAATFEGVPLTKLMEYVGAKGTEIEAVALNDYRTTIPISDFAEFGTILAMKRDGVEMPVRDKGPLFIIYPYDSNADLHAQKYYSRSVWQIARMNVR